MALPPAIAVGSKPKIAVVEAWCGGMLSQNCPPMIGYKGLEQLVRAFRGAVAWSVVREVCIAGIPF